MQSMYQYMVQHQVSLVHHFCDTFYALQQANINSHTLQQNNIESTVDYRQIHSMRLGRFEQIIPRGQPLATNTVVEPGPLNTHQTVRSLWKMALKLNSPQRGIRTNPNSCAADFTKHVTEID